MHRKMHRNERKMTEKHLNESFLTNEKRRRMNSMHFHPTIHDFVTRNVDLKAMNCSVSANKIDILFHFFENLQCNWTTIEVNDWRAKVETEK